MDILYILVLSILIGALIGGFTNFLAIHMLFRPFQKKQWGNWTIPFTPGLIPKRKEEIAKQIGRTVERYLITVPSLERRVASSLFREHLEHWLSAQVEQWSSSTQTIGQWLSSKQKDPASLSQYVQDKLDGYVHHYLEEVWDQCKQKPLDDFVPLTEHDVDELVAKATAHIVQKGKEYIFSPEGEQHFNQFVHHALDQGTFLQMVGMFIPREKIIEKGKVILLTWLSQSSTQERLREEIKEEIDKQLKQPLGEILQSKHKQNVLETIKSYIHEYVSIEEWLQQPIHVWLHPFKEELIQFIPQVAQLVQNWMIDYTPALYDKVQVAELVEEQILAFPLPHLEQMLRRLANKELKMITAFGALLGGGIGLIQAVVIQFIL